MTDLERSFRALRDLHDGRSDAAARTRTQILLFASARRKKRRVLALVIAPLAAALAFSIAWAAATGRMSSWLDDVASHARTDRSAQPAAAPPPTLPTITPSVTSDVPARVEVETLDAGAPTPVASSRPTPSTVARPTDIAVRDAGAREEDALYQRAHRAHFVAHDSAAALRGWDDYLRTYPSGRFALEARYNRALALVRLGRYSEGRAALAPFAAGQYGGYRQSEARALLDAMDAGP